MNTKTASDRLSILRNLMKEFDIEVLAINAGKDLKYISGLDFHLSERPVVLFIPTEGVSALVYPAFETTKAESSKIELQLFPYQEDSSTWVDIFKKAFSETAITDTSIGVSPGSLRFLELDLMQSALKHKKIFSAEGVFRQLYIQKDETAVNAIREAVRIAENAFTNILPNIKPGKTEKQISNELFISLLREGSEADLPFEPIIASGPNSANPHATPSDRILENGDVLIVDWGARHNGYVSDMTRSFLIGKVNEEFKIIAQIVKQANQTARDMIKPGIKAKEIDAAARNHIVKSGFGEYFTHRTGHGIGLEEHENPYISQSSEEILNPGMSFTIEPGIYIPGKGGIRIEDNVIVTQDRHETLTSLPRDLAVL